MGKENLEADALSKAPIDVVNSDEDHKKLINLMTIEEIKEYQGEMMKVDQRERLNEQE